MTIKTRLIAITTTIVLLAGCVVPAQQPFQTSRQTAQQREPLNQESLKTLLGLAGIREEIKRLRNSIEEIQFETENAKQRQQDLFQKLEYRIANLERNQQVLNVQLGISPQVDANNQQGGEDGSGLVNSVVVGGDNALSNDLGTDSSGATNTAGDPIAPTQNTPSLNDPSTAPVSSPQTVTKQEQQAYDQAFQLLTQSRYKDAVAQFQSMIETWTQSPLADDAYYWMSEARYVNREFEHALSGFRTLINKYPDSPRVPEALLKIGYIQHDIGDYKKAADTFRDILLRFPGHQVIIPAQTRLRRIEQTIQ